MSVFKELWEHATPAGLLWKPVKKATGLTDAQMAGIAGLAIAAPFAAPALMGGAAAGAGTAGSAAAGTSGAAGASAGGAAAADAGLMSYAKPALSVLQGASMAKGLMGGGQPQPIQGAQLQSQPANFSGLLSRSPIEQEQQRRLMQQQQATMCLLGRNYG